MSLRFHVPGVPAPQGSKTRNRFGGVRDDNPNARPWRDSIVWEARHARNGTPTILEPVNVVLAFELPRLKGHYRTGKHADELRPSAPTYHTVKPDLDKLARTVLDALTIAGVIRDDSQVSALRAMKVYSDSPGVSIAIEPLHFPPIVEEAHERQAQHP